MTTAMPARADGVPILVAVGDPRPQSRGTALVRLALVVPHAVALYLLQIAAAVVAVAGWFAAVATGTLPAFAHDFLSGVLGWQARVQGYLLFLTGRYPPFALDVSGERDPYPVAVAVPPRGGLGRVAVLFRLPLALPAALLAGIVGAGAQLFAVAAWIAVLVGGTLPVSFHRAFAVVLRYGVRTTGYLWMLTAAYPGGLFGDGDGPPGTVPVAGPSPGSLPWPAAAPTATGAWQAGPDGDLWATLVFGQPPATTGSEPPPGAGAEAVAGGGATVAGSGEAAARAEAVAGSGEAAARAEAVAGGGADAGRSGAGWVPADPPPAATPAPDVFTYAGLAWLWGYTADRQVCGMWRRDDPGAPGRTWPIGDQDEAWARFREAEPGAVAYDGPAPAELGFASGAVAGAPGAPWGAPAPAGGWGPAPAAAGAWGPAPASAGGWGPAPAAAGAWGPAPASAGGWGPAPSAGGWGPAPSAGAWGPAPASAGGWGPAPRRWDLRLTSGARALVVACIVVGLLWLPLAAVAELSASRSLSRYVQAFQAETAIQQDYANLSSSLAVFDQRSQACVGRAQPLPCQAAADGTFAAALATFVHDLRAVAVPARAEHAEQVLVADGEQAASTLHQLSAAGTPSRYRQIVATSDLQQALTNFDTDFANLQSLLQQS